MGVTSSVANNETPSNIGIGGHGATSIQDFAGRSNVTTSNPVNHQNTAHPGEEQLLVTAIEDESQRRPVVAANESEATGAQNSISENNVGPRSPRHITANYVRKFASKVGSPLKRDDDPSQTIWCLIKARTRQHASSKEIKKTFWFEARDGCIFTIGRDAGCDLSLDDDRCEMLNARLLPTVLSCGKPGVLLHPDSRMYKLIGMSGRINQPQVIKKGSVIKVGSISLEVLDFCTDEASDFAERFAAEIRGEAKQRVIGSTSKMLPIEQRVGCSSGGESNNESEGTIERDSSDVTSGADVEDGADPSQNELESDAMCYICWGGSDATDTTPGAEELKSSEADTNVCKEDNATATITLKEEADLSKTETLKPPTNPDHSLNPLIRNPCGHCSGCSKYVHLQCLLTWIKKSGSGHCSICNGVLPSHFASSPPNMELKIVRHRRGHSWVGTRRFRLSFAENNRSYIGNSSRANLRLPDRSVSDLHAVIKFDRRRKRFILCDNHSKGGTFLQINEPVELSQAPNSPQAITEFKIGRTNLSVKIAPKRNNLLHMIQLPGWGKGR